MSVVTALGLTGDQLGHKVWKKEEVDIFIFSIFNTKYCLTCKLVVSGLLQQEVPLVEGVGQHGPPSPHEVQDVSEHGPVSVSRNI